MMIKVLITCCALAAPVSAIAADPAQEGMTVVRDSRTGKLRAPTTAELRALRNKVNPDRVNPDRPITTTTPAQPPGPLKSTVRPDGTRSIDLGERGMVYSVMRRNTDGTLAGYCVDGEHAAALAIANKQEAKHAH